MTKQQSLEKIKKFEVKMYFSTFCSHQIKANNEMEALEKTRGLKIDENEVMANIESWEDADTLEDIKG